MIVTSRFRIETICYNFHAKLSDWLQNFNFKNLLKRNGIIAKLQSKPCTPQVRRTRLEELSDCERNWIDIREKITDTLWLVTHHKSEFYYHTWPSLIFGTWQRALLWKARVLAESWMGTSLTQVNQPSPRLTIASRVWSSPPSDLSVLSATFSTWASSAGVAGDAMTTRWRKWR